MPDTSMGDDSPNPETIKQPRLWKDNGWTATVIKNENDDGWAVAMTMDGEAEPALVGPWTMGRDKKNPKPLDTGAFLTLVKTASEVLRRHEQHQHAELHKRLTLTSAEGPLTISLDIVPDDDDAHAWLAATDARGDQQARVRVRPDFKLNRSSAEAWIASGFEKPAWR